ncbi:malectin domain-containing carbohydrate-binding protein [Geotalea sp. SG265]|uniref:malectin domain-containing carbohydrate-binding protein n=1 Tax=Geotalea sp. SG265 TaxID=2922867 RepID=UPI001FAFD362|nr:malectin domain-containing carbohydrate-binding protein [Geotalea sp. SG265]
MASSLCAGHAMAAQTTLAWDPPTTYVDGTPLTAVGGYRVYAGTAPGNYSLNFDAGTATSYTFTTLSDATTYYFAVSAYDTTGLASALSNELLYATPAAPVPVFTLTASAGAGGSITPPGSTIISQGMSQTYTITPAAGYSIAAVQVDGASVGTASSYTFSNVNASHTIQATFTAVTAATSFAVDCGGAAYTDAAGTIYGTDKAFSGGSTGKTTAAIAGTTDDLLYQSERWGNFSYSIPVANGSYTLTLKFAEIYFSSAGQRVFSVTVNGQTVISNLDIYAKVGKNTAYDVVIPVNVTNGAINIGFTSTKDYGKISAIRIVPSALLFATNSGGAQFTDSTGNPYQADGNFKGGYAAKTTAAIAGTTDDTLYQSERWGNFSYTIPAANGNYLVTLKFAEIYFSAAGQRVFNVAINGQTMISNLDIYAKVGKNTAYDVSVPVVVTNGAITITFTSTKDYGKVSAILIQKM